MVENGPGSNGNIAAEIAAGRAPTDIRCCWVRSLFGINPNLYAKMPVDPHKEFVPVATGGSNQLVLTVNPALVPVNDFREFVALTARTKPPLFYASIGNGSQHHLAMELLKQRAGISSPTRPTRAADRPRSRWCPAKSRPCSVAARSCRW